MKSPQKNHVMSFLIFTKAHDLGIWLFVYSILVWAFVNNFLNTFIAILSLEPWQKPPEQSKLKFQTSNSTAGDRFLSEY